LQIITNGIYPSIEHRATVNSEKERISLATFYGPDMQAMLAPAPSLVTQERPAQFRRISVVDHFNGYFAQELRGKSYLNEILSIWNKNKKMPKIQMGIRKG
jgi:isopenicillin N synthase-like dioxygenase